MGLFADVPIGLQSGIMKFKKLGHRQDNFLFHVVFSVLEGVRPIGRAKVSSQSAAPKLSLAQLPRKSGMHGHSAPLCSVRTRGVFALCYTYTMNGELCAACAHRILSEKALMDSVGHDCLHVFELDLFFRGAIRSKIEEHRLLKEPNHWCGMKQVSQILQN